MIYVVTLTLDPVDGSAYENEDRTIEAESFSAAQEIAKQVPCSSPKVFNVTGWRVISLEAWAEERMYRP